MSTGATRHRIAESPLSKIGFWGGMTVAFVLGWLAVNKVAWHMASRTSHPEVAPGLGSDVGRDIPQESPAENPSATSIAATDLRDASTAGMPTAHPNPGTESALVAEEAPVVPLSDRNEGRAPRDAYRKTLDALSALYE